MNRAITLWGYAVLAAVAIASQGTAVVLRRTATLGEALRRVTRLGAGRFALLAAWLWAGWHIFVRRS